MIKVHTKGAGVGQIEQVSRLTKQQIERLIDACWLLQRTHFEGGDIGVGQLFDEDLFNTIMAATQAFGKIGVIDEQIEVSGK